MIFTFQNKLQYSFIYFFRRDLVFDPAHFFNTLVQLLIGELDASELTNGFADNLADADYGDEVLWLSYSCVGFLARSLAHSRGSIHKFQGCSACASEITDLTLLQSRQAFSAA